MDRLVRLHASCRCATVAEIRELDQAVFGEDEP
jgi:hypothetical protein